MPFVPRLAQNLSVQDHDGVPCQHPVARPTLGDVAGFFESHAPDEGARCLSTKGSLVYLGNGFPERNAELLEVKAPARRGRGQDQSWGLHVLAVFKP